MNTQLKEKTGELHAARVELMELTQDEAKLRLAGPDEIHRRNEAIKSLNDEVGKLREVDAIAAENAREIKAMGEVPSRRPFSGTGTYGDDTPPAGNAFGGDGGSAMKSLGQMFVESDAYKLKSDTRLRPIEANLEVSNVKAMLDMASMKTTLTTSGYAPFVPRSPRLIETAQRRPVIADLIPQDTTTAAGFKYMEETTFTNNAARVAEGAVKPESALAFTERVATMVKIATTLPVSDEVLDDVPAIRSYIDNRLTLQIELTEETGLLSYTAGAEGFDGFLQKTGVQSQALGADPVPTAIMKAITLIRYTGFADPTGIIMHPNDWQAVITLQETTGGYLFSPGGAPIDMVGQRIWGLPVVVTPAMTENTALLGDFRMYSQILRREGIRIDIGYSGDDWVRNLQRIRAEERLTLLIFRAAAFAKVTGI